ncbi:hypothetical protein EVAR_17325_1 [Eumeta japonica]|uniref:Uncharacterized protein n=1 Tax=Eumeta variegata TaxID=151549 RepID=A0A4C1TT97_EUMVA|nr:hypothetical protein EVAR_17325_1 [Eumeta japonica]
MRFRRWRRVGRTSPLPARPLRKRETAYVRARPGLISHKYRKYNVLHARARSTVKQAYEPPESKCSPPPKDTRDPRGLTSALPASREGIAYLVEVGAS